MVQPSFAQRTFERAPHAIILAAGKGTRMGSDKAKVLHEVQGKPMVWWVIKACREAGVRRCVIVVGYQGDEVRKALKDEPECVFVEQAQQLGTGHAVMMAEPLYESTPSHDIFVLAGDGPLIRADTLRTLLGAHREARAAATLATAVLDDPSGYGRIVRDDEGNFDRIIEQKDATPDQLAIKEVNPSYYCFRGEDLFPRLAKLSNSNAQGEYYLTDIPGLCKADGEKVAVVDAVPPEDVLSINTPEQLEAVNAIMMKRANGKPAADDTTSPEARTIRMSSADRDGLKIFCGRASRNLAEHVCRYLDLPLGQGHTDMFPDGELLVKIEEDVRGRDCFVVQSTYHPVNAHLMELLIYIDTLKRASARRITAVIPYFGYARQDRKDEGRTPITAKLVANLITTAGADRVLAMDMHAEQIQGFFDIPVDHLHAAPVIVKYLNTIRDELGDIVLLSPDVGNVKAAKTYANWLGGELAIVDKRRKSGTEIESANIIGEVKGKTAIMVDDMISTAGTMCGAAKLSTEHGAANVIAACTHPVLVGLAMERIDESPISKVIVTDTIPCGDRCKKIEKKLVELSIAELLGEAIYRIHHDRSVSSLLRQVGARD